AWLAKNALDLGFYLSFSGVITFQNATMLRDIVKTVPLDRTLVETDSPYLAPVPHRGKRNEPAYVRHVAEKIAEIHGLSVKDVEEATTQNATRLSSVRGGRRNSKREAAIQAARRAATCLPWTH